MHFHLESAFGEILELHVQGLRGFVKSLRYDLFTENELKLHFDDIGMTIFDQDRILEGWRVDKQSAIVKIRKMERLLNYQRAEDKLREANNFYFLNLLYISDVVSEKCKDLLANLHKYMNYLDPDLYKTQTSERLEEIKKLRQTILPEKRNSVRIEMQKELRIE
ncbi:hypothetical protein [Peribacillus sp. NPDC097895]|uniref:hypothetical protein n=1 Tax=Peribacillus sp. NPDC097895 TaxID=3390619 RepID=UPI003D004087